MQVAYNGATPSVAPMGVTMDQMFAPQGFLGGALGSALGGLGGGAIGRAFGNQNLGRQIGNVAGGVLGGLLPFDAGPQAYAGTYYVPQTAAPGFAPQGFVGDALGAIGAPLGGFIGGRFGNAGLGQTIGGTVGGLAQRFLPFDAGPQQQPVYYYAPQSADPSFAPQGFIGDALGAVGGRVGNWIGGRFGNAGARSDGWQCGGRSCPALPAVRSRPAAAAAACLLLRAAVGGSGLCAAGLGRRSAARWAVSSAAGSADASGTSAALGASARRSAASSAAVSATLDWQTIGGTVGGLAQRFLPFGGSAFRRRASSAMRSVRSGAGLATGSADASATPAPARRLAMWWADLPSASCRSKLARSRATLALIMSPRRLRLVSRRRDLSAMRLARSARPVGGWIGGRFGNAGLGQTIGSTVGGLAQRFLPFDAGATARLLRAADAGADVRLRSEPRNRRGV